MLHALAAANVLKLARLPLGGVTAETLNDVVAGFPAPADAVRLLDLKIGGLPILFHDITVKDLAEVLGAFIFEGGMPWPIFYMPVNRMEHWANDPLAVEFLKYLQKNRLDVQLTLGGPATWLRGHWVTLCDIRLRFTDDVTVNEMALIDSYSPALLKHLDNKP